MATRHRRLPFRFELSLTCHTCLTNTLYIMRKNELSERLHRVREELCGGSNKEFAERLGVSPQYASAICTGHRSPRRETLERLLEVFPQVRRAWLLQGEGEMLSGGATGWTTSMSSTPEEMQTGRVPGHVPPPGGKPAGEGRPDFAACRPCGKKISNMVSLGVDEEGNLFVKIKVDC